MPRAAGQDSSAPSRRLPGVALLLLLLFGPLAAAEFWTRQQLDLLYPYLQDRMVWPDAKLMLLEREGCPQVLGLGSSVTNRTIVAELTRGLALPFADGVKPVERTFSFGLDGAPSVVSYIVWRNVHARGCTPPYVFVEVLPGRLGSRFFGHALLRPMMDVRTQLHVPSDFYPLVGIDARKRLRWGTWDRLMLHRLRGPVRTALLERWGWQPFSGSLNAVPAVDGMIEPLSDVALSWSTMPRERAKRIRLAKQGHYADRVHPVQIEALRRLVREARAAGSRVVLHTPPVTGVHRDIAGLDGRDAEFCAVRRELEAHGPIEWHWAYAGGGFEPRHFRDWIHLNRAGGRHYTRLLFEAIRENRVLDDAWCEGR